MSNLTSISSRETRHDAPADPPDAHASQATQASASAKKAAPPSRSPGTKPALPPVVPDPPPVKLAKGALTNPALLGAPLPASKCTNGPAAPAEEMVSVPTIDRHPFLPASQVRDQGEITQGHAVRPEEVPGHVLEQQLQMQKSVASDPIAAVAVGVEILIGGDRDTIGKVTHASDAAWGVAGSVAGFGEGVQLNNREHEKGNADQAPHVTRTN